MKISDLKQYVEQNASWPDGVVFGRHLSTPEDESRYCIVEDNGLWYVYAMERGQRLDERIFASEQEACEYFFQWIKGDHAVFSKRT